MNSSMRLALFAFTVFLVVRGLMWSGSPTSTPRRLLPWSLLAVVIVFTVKNLAWS